MKKHVYLTLLCLVILPTALFAQNNYEPGYILTYDLDTIYGFIDLRPESISQKNCRFKTSLSAIPKEFHPGEIMGYRFTPEGKYYISKEITIEGSTKKVFIEYMVKGMLNLYYYREADKDYYFFEKEDGKLLPVTQKPEEIVNLKIKKDQSYKAIVFSYFPEFEHAAEKIKDLDFGTKSFIELSKAYHREMCDTNEECIVFENKNPHKSRLVFRFSAFAGYQSTAYVFVRVRSYSTLEAEKARYAPVLGGQVNLSIPQVSNALSVQLELAVSQLEGKTEPQYLGNGVNGFYDFKVIPLTTRFGVKYTYPKGKIRPTAEAGLALSFLLNQSATSTVYTSYNEYTENYDMKKTFFGLYGGIGLDYIIKDKQSIFLRAVLDYYFNSETQSSTGPLDKFKIAHIKLGYTF